MMLQRNSGITFDSINVEAIPICICKIITTRKHATDGMAGYASILDALLLSQCSCKLAEPIGT